MAANPFSLDLSQGSDPRALQGFGDALSGLGQVVSQKREQESAQARQQQVQVDMQAAIETGDPAKISEFMRNNPEQADSVKQSMGFEDEMVKTQAVDFMKGLLSSPDEQWPAMFKERIEMLESQGRDPSDTIKIMQSWANNPEQGKKGVETILAMSDQDAFEAYKDSIDPDQGIDVKVGAQEILEDGTIIQSTSKGPVVYGPTGEKLTGQDASDAIAAGRAAKVSNLRLAAGEKKRASLEAEDDLKGKVEAGIITQKEAAKASVTAYKKLEGVNKNIANIDEAIRLLDEGASTGAVQSMMPSVRTASVKLDNLQKRLGIDIIGSVTFGALSQGELDLALSTALPTRLKPAELKEWLQGKRNAQEKLADYLESAVIHLGTPGNTHSTWLQYQKDKGGTPGIGAKTEDNQALDWAKSNPDDPRAAKILALQGG